MSFNTILYGLTGILLILSAIRDKGKTKAALIKAWKAFINIMPDLIVVLALIGLILTYLSPTAVAGILGSGSGIWGILLASIIGAITLIPAFVAFPLAASLMERGAGVVQIAAFISTLMMVGVVTLPLEIKYFGRRTAIMRNTLAYLFSFLVAAVIGVVVGR